MRNFAPRTILQNEALVQREQPKGRPFSAGVWNDVPASEVPENGIAYASGYVPREYGVEAATGVLLYGTATLPLLSGRTGYSLTKSGTTVIKTAGTDFTVTDIGNFIVFDDGVHERITGFVDKDTVTVDESDVHAASTAAVLHGPINATYTHRSTGKVLLHIDTRLFYSTPALDAYVEIPCVSYRKLANIKSCILEERDRAIIVSSTGIFKVDLGAELIVYYKINSPNPQTLITGAAKTTAKPYGHKYLFAMTRITGDGDTRSRMSDDAVIEHETGTSQYDENGVDYAEVWHERPAGNASTTYGVLTGAALSNPYTSSSGWTGITNGQFHLSIDGVDNNFQADFSDCKSMADVAARIQSALRWAHSSITCEYVSDHFVITNPVESGTVSYVSAGDEGTDIGTAIMACDSGVATTSNPDYTQVVTAYNLNCPTDPTATPAVHEYHHTHYSVYRTLDIGANSIDPITGVGNNEEQFIWLFDVPIAKAFVASRTGDTVTATAGEFQEMDVGCKLRFQDGTEVEILAFVSATQVTTTSSGGISSQAAAIGGDNSESKAIRVMTAGQSGTTVTRTAGTSFSASDVGKTIFFAGGLRAHIAAYLTADTVTVSEAQTIASTGACIDPKCRAFTDSIPDDTLRPRITNFSLRHRFWEPLPESSRGVLVPGFFYVWATESKTLYYGHIPVNKEYLTGSHNPEQYTTFKDKIVMVSEFPDSIAIYCSNSWSKIPTNTYTTVNVNDVLAYYRISGQAVVDHERGILGPSWLKKLPNGTDWLVTNEPAVRICDGNSFSPNLAENRYMKVIEALLDDATIHYDRFHGITVFGGV